MLVVKAYARRSCAGCRVSCVVVWCRAALLMWYYRMLKSATPRVRLSGEMYTVYTPMCKYVVQLNCVATRNHLHAATSAALVCMCEFVRKE